MTYLYYLLKESLFYFGKQTKLVLFLFVISSLLDVIAIVSIIPFIQTIFFNSIPYDSLLVTKYSTLLNKFGIEINFISTGIIVFFLFIAVRATNYFADKKTNIVCQDIKIKLQEEVLLKFKNSSIFYFLNQPAGLITNLYNKEIPLVAESYRLILISASRLLIFAFIAFFMLYNDFYFMLIILFLTMLFIFIMKKFYKKIELASATVVQKAQELSTKVNFYINNISAIKSSEINTIKLDEIKKNNNETRTAILKNYNYGLLLSNLIEPIFIFFIISIAYLVSRIDSFFSGSLVVSFGILLRFSRHFFTIQNFYIKIINWKKYVNSKNIHFSLLEEHNSKLEINSKKIDRISLIEIKNLTLRLSGRTIIRNLTTNFNVPFFIKINGMNGSGKSSLAKAICGFFPVENNQILINKNCINSLHKENMYKQILYIDKNPFILSGSLIDNILINCEMNKELENRILYFLKIFELKIFDKNNLYDNLIKENGNNLSHGQIQKISIIRSLILRPSIIILDEATSNIEEKTENKIYEVLFEEVKLNGGSIISISHNKTHDFIFEKIINLDDYQDLVL